MSNSLQSSTGRSLLAPMLFAALETEAQAFLRAAGQMRRFSDGQIIQQRGDDPHGVWLIESGAVVVGQYRNDGEFRSVALLGPGDSYGELALFAARPRVVDAIARGPSELILFPARAFEALFTEHPQVMRAMLGSLAAQLQEVLGLVAGYRSGSSLTRAAGLIANLAGQEPGKHAVSITQQEIAEFLGLSRATTNKVLGELEARGLLGRSYGKLLVHDSDALRSLAMSTA